MSQAPKPRLHHLVLILAVLAATLPGPAGAVEPLEADPPIQTLRGTNRIDTAENAHAVVRLPGNVPLGSAAQHVVVETNGSHAAVALVERIRSDAAVYLVAWFDDELFCERPCPQLPESSRYQGHILNAPSFALPAGVYDLYVVVSDAPVTVTLTLPPLGGEQVVETTGYAGITTDLPSNRNPLGAYSPFYAGSSADLPRKGLLYRLVGASGQISAPGLIGDCTYVGDEPDTLAYLPGCPLAPDSGRTELLHIGTTGWTALLSVLLAHVGPNHYGQGGNYTGASTVERAGVLSIWLPYHEESPHADNS